MPLSFPLDLRFKLLAIASQIAVRDANGHIVLYAKQKAFKLKEAVTVFADERQTTPLYRIAADRILDFSARYRIEDAAGTPLGVVQRRGMRSLWRAHYDVERGGEVAFHIREENPWIKVIDGLFSEVPVIGLWSGYILHPAYALTRAADGAPLLRAVKEAAFFEGRYRIDRAGDGSEEDETLGVLALLMMLLLERSRG